jgi:hypothetical protein
MGALVAKFNDMLSSMPTEHYPSVVGCRNVAYISEAHNNVYLPHGRSSTAPSMLFGGQTSSSATTMPDLGSSPDIEDTNATLAISIPSPCTLNVDSISQGCTAPRLSTVSLPSTLAPDDDCELLMEEDTSTVESTLWQCRVPQCPERLLEDGSTLLDLNEILPPLDGLEVGRLNVSW